MLEYLIDKQNDVLLIAKTSFGKSLIFQLAPLVASESLDCPGIALILMPLTLLQKEQAETVKNIPGAKPFILEGCSNTREKRALIASGYYTHRKCLGLVNGIWNARVHLSMA